MDFWKSSVESLQNQKLQAPLDKFQLQIQQNISTFSIQHSLISFSYKKAEFLNLKLKNVSKVFGFESF